MNNITLFVLIPFMSLFITRVALKDFNRYIRHNITHRKRIRPLDCPKCFAGWTAITYTTLKIYDNITIINVLYSISVIITVMTISHLIERIYDQPQNFHRGG